MEKREERIERLKSEFIALAAHQLRTPLSAVKWILRMLLDGDIGKLTNEQKEFIGRAYQNNERMITLINDLLNVVNIEEGRFLYDFSHQSIEAIIKKVITNLEERAKDKRIKIIFKKPDQPLPQILMDVQKIELVVKNLLDNAISYSPEGENVTISVQSDKMNIKVVVKDNGIGILPHQAKRIFTRFFRGDNAIKMETEGSGLGLFICKNIIEAHKGKIGFEKETQGTSFYFTLPINNEQRD